MTRPNLLFIFTDEQRADTMAAYGSRLIHTPNLNRLAEQSIVFERCYVTQSVCTPSRSSIMTGLYPHTNGCTQNNVPLPADVACLPEMLPAGRWVAGYHGKWHLGDEIYAQHGFDDWVSIEDCYTAYYAPGRDRSDRSTYHHWLVSQGIRPAGGNRFGRGQAARLPERLGKPAFLAQTASRFIRENRHRPFVLYVNFLEPHMPFFGPRDGQYDPAEVELPGNFNCPPTEDQPLKTRLFRQKYWEKGHSGMPLKTEADWRRMIANYWGLCSLVDTHVGTILATLDDCGLMERTIIVYTSDHGDMMGSHRLLAKCTQFEEAVRVPLLVRMPGQTSGRRVRQPVSQIDLAAALLDLLGCPAPPQLQGGRSLRSTISGRGVRGESVFIEWNGTNTGCLTGEAPPGGGAARLPTELTDPVRTVVTPDGWKFNCSTVGEHELYDLSADPLETRNLARRCGQKKRMIELRDSIARWQEKTGDKVELPAI
ncbi:MAG: sulfatase-like hydrolase/transferase [Planctomycetota bacterium]|jgi:arylsulfatase A-like enzyme